MIRKTGKPQLKYMNFKKLKHSDKQFHVYIYPLEKYFSLQCCERPSLGVIVLTTDYCPGLRVENGTIPMCF